MRFSSRVDMGEPNAIAQAEIAVARHGTELRKLNDSNPTRFGLAPHILSEEYDANPRGPLMARHALANFLNERNSLDLREPSGIDADSLYVLSSTSQAYSWLFKLLCDPGDIVLAPKPGYPLIASIAKLEGVATMDYRLQYDGSWFIDTAEVEALLEADTQHRIKALVVINPNNPTGSYVKPGERERFIELCCKYEVAIIADEVFYDYDLKPFEGNARWAGEKEVLTFALDGFSKMLAAPHAKVGWIQVSGPQEDVEQAQHRLDVIADDYLPMGDLIATRIPELLALAPEQTALVKQRVKNNFHMVQRILEQRPEHLVSLLRAEGGWNVLLRFPAVVDDDSMVLTLIERHGLSGQPGYFFDMASDGYLAVSLLPGPEELTHRINEVLDTIAMLCKA